LYVLTYKNNYNFCCDNFLHIIIIFYVNMEHLLILIKYEYKITIKVPYFFNIVKFRTSYLISIDCPISFSSSFSLPSSSYCNGGIKNINGGPLSRKSLLILRHKNAYTPFSYKRILFLTGGYTGADGVNVRRYSRFSFARLPIHLAVSAYHDRYFIQVNLYIS